MKNIRDIKLTPEVLLDLGFFGESRDILNKPAYRISTGKGDYRYLQIVLGDYPDDNPNSGVVSLYDIPLTDQHCLTYEKKTGQDIKKSKKIDFVTSEDEENYYGIKYVSFPGKCTPIAHNVTTVGRLLDIYSALYQTELDTSKLFNQLKPPTNGTNSVE